MSRGKVRVFISHASRDDQASKTAVHKLKALLDQLGFDPKVDDQLRSGEWHPQLIEWMMTCHAAVIVLGSNAVQNSAWVACESFLLRARHQFDPQLKILPIVLPSVTIEEIQSARLLAPAQLSNLTILKECDFERRLQDELNGVQPIDLFPESVQPFIQRLMDILNPLQRLALDRISLGRALEHFNHSCDLTLVDIMRDLLVYRLTNTPLPTCINAIKGFSLDADDLRKLVLCVAPLWINEIAAMQLKGYLTDGTDFSINTGQDYELASCYTAPWYLARAVGYPILELESTTRRPVSNHFRLIVLESPDLSLPNQALKQKIVEKLLKAKNVRNLDQLNNKLRSKNASSKPIVVAFPSILTAEKKDMYAELLAQLRREFPSIVWLHLAYLPTTALEWTAKECSDNGIPNMLQPLLNTDTEAEAVDAFCDFMSM